MIRPELVIVTGFLGAGKTTILSRLLGCEGGSETGVVINEAGIGVDDLLLEAGESSVTVLQNGCLCCLSKGSLTPALSQLTKERERQGVPQFRRIAVETSGLADPAPILEEIASSPFCNRVVSFTGLVTVIDARAFDKSYADHPQAARQVAFADRLLITKTDLVTDVEREALQAKLAALNAEAPQIIVPFTGSVDRSLWPEALELLDRSQRHKAMPASAKTPPAIAVVSITFDGSLDESALEEWLEHTQMLFGPSLLRLKAILDLNESPVPVAVHGVLGVVHAPSVMKQWPTRGPRNRAVLIGKDVADNLLEDALHRLRSLASLHCEDKLQPVKAWPQTSTQHALGG
ncbi:MAG: GTP-binding protein [Rhodomicrobium sp.]